MSALYCGGCGRAIADNGAGPAAGPYVCPDSGDGGDHVLSRRLDASVRFPVSEEANPFVRYRTLTHAYSVARAAGMSDDAFTNLVLELDAAVKDVWGAGFVVTPFAESPALGDAVGARIWVKDETRNVSGSHKARHLMGLAILGEVEARVRGTSDSARLAIASCGNAALAAAAVARAWKRPLDAFIPDDANPAVVRALARFGASIHVCPRVAGATGDPCYLAFREAVKQGAIPFCCQGSDNGLTIEGGETLGWEIIDALSRRGETLDRLFVQVGGGALASACVAAFHDAAAAGSRTPMPRIHAVQTSGAYPLRRAWERVVARIAPRLDLPLSAADGVLAEEIKKSVREPAVTEALDYASRHRSEFMWAWEGVPTSIAHGILDDETYDWLAIVRGMLESGGFPIVVSEAQLVKANELGRKHTGIDVDETGSSGLAGVLALALAPRASRENIGVIFSGARR